MHDKANLERAPGGTALFQPQSGEGRSGYPANALVAGSALIVGVATAVVLHVSWPASIPELDGVTAGIVALFVNACVYIGVSVVFSSPPQEQARVDRLFAAPDEGSPRESRVPGGAFGRERPMIAVSLPGNEAAGPREAGAGGCKADGALPKNAIDRGGLWVFWTGCSTTRRCQAQGRERRSSACCWMTREECRTWC